MHDAPKPITPRQKEVADLHNAGKNDAEIAEILGISKKTVQSHRRPSHMLRANGKGAGRPRRKRKYSTKRKSGWPAYCKRLRAIAGYTKYESVRRDARREARKQLIASNIFKPYKNPFVGRPQSTSEIMDEWGMPHWREWIWQYVDYSKHETENG